MKRLPRKVRILTRVYQIKVNNEIQKYAECDRHNCVITINKKKCETPAVIAQTLWHEIGHAFAWESGMCNFLESMAEEMFVENFAALIIDLTSGKISQK